MVDRFSNCVKMNLAITKQIGERRSVFSRFSRLNLTHPRQLNLQLSINFSDGQEIDVPGGGRARFGIARGELQLKLEGCRLPLSGVSEIGSFDISLPVDRQNTRENEIAGSLASDKANLGSKRAESVVETSTINKFQLKYLGGDDDAPSWRFEAFEDKDRKILERGLRDFLLGIIDVNKIPCKVRATFSVKGEDVCLTWGRFAATKDVSRNQLAFIERFWILHYLRSYVEQSPLSECEAQYD